MKRVQIGVFLTVLACANAANAQNWNPMKEVALANMMMPFIGNQTPSLTVSVSINGNIVTAKGFGQIAPGTVPAPDTVYHIGSVTKQFTAAGILSLAESGARNVFGNKPFAIDDRVSDFFAQVDGWGDLRVRQLLTMTSGLPSFTENPPPGLPAGTGVPWQAMLNAFKMYPRNPFPNYHYSNTNYFLLGQIIEVLTQTGPGSFGNYEDFIRSKILTPTGMNNTGFIGRYLPGTNVAPPYFKHPPMFSFPDWPKGAGNIASTVLDMQKWNQALMNGQIIGSASLNTMLTSATMTNMPGVSYGMGWMIAPQPGVQQFFHGGNVGGFTAFNGIVRRASDGSTVSVVILTNADDVPGLDQAGGAIARLAFN